MCSRELAFGKMGSDVGRCSDHDPVYVLVELEYAPPLLFIPTRDLVMSESISDTPSFLFTCSVQKRQRENSERFNLQLVDIPGKINLVWMGGEFLICGSLQYFSSCKGKDYNLLWN
jgi:hypothetical protein